MSLHRRMVVAVVGLVVSLSAAQAGPIPVGTFNYQTTATQSVELFDGTPLNMSGASQFFTTAATGSLVVTYSPERVDPVLGTVVDTSPVADLVGTAPFPYRIVAGAAFGVPATAGVISNIVPDPLDPNRLLSADFREEAYFLLLIPGGAGPNTVIYTDPVNPAIITADLTGVPYPVGQIFDSPARLNLYLQLTPGVFDPTTDILVGQSFNRSFIILPAAVPEPASVGLVLVGAAGLAARRLRRKTLG